MSFKQLIRTLLCLSIISILSSPAFAIVGVGVHYGYDVSLSMADKLGEQAALSELNLPVSQFGALPTGYTKEFLTGKDLPVTISRTDFKRNAFNIGGKFYVDIIPFINALELSVNYGMWEYNGMIKYPTSIVFNTTTGQNTQNITEIATIHYDSTEIKIADNPFLKNTPYAKLNIDLTARKYIVKFPPAVNIVKIYGGAGATVNFATPILSAGFIDKAIGTTLSSATDVTALKADVFDPSSPAMKKLGEEFMKQLFTPHYGAHLDLGAMIKIPLMPIGIYIDGKFMIPFGQLDENVKELKSTGLLFNAGLAFAL